MILLDTDGNVYTDSNEVVTPDMLSVITPVIRFPNSTILYREDEDGELVIYDISTPTFRGIRLELPEVVLFKKLHEVTTDVAHVKDIGANIVRAYFDDYHFDIPLELMMR